MHVELSVTLRMYVFISSYTQFSIHIHLYWDFLCTTTSAHTSRLHVELFTFTSALSLQHFTATHTRAHTSHHTTHTSTTLHCTLLCTPQHSSHTLHCTYHNTLHAQYANLIKLSNSLSNCNCSLTLPFLSLTHSLSHIHYTHHHHHSAPLISRQQKFFNNNIPHSQILQQLAHFNTNSSQKFYT